MLAIGFGLLLVGFGFKISSVPFHMWAPDVYEGAPTSITALIATGSKAAAFAALLRVLLTALRGAPLDWPMLLWVMAAITMTVGNVVALAQQNIKRMLAYSSIAHVGYMLVGVVAGGSLGAGAVLFYLLVYTFTTAGAFGAVLLLERNGREAVELADYGGLAARHPVLAVALSVFLLSLIGIPPTAGFVGKFYLFGAAVQSGYVWLAVIGVLNSARRRLLLPAPHRLHVHARARGRAHRDGPVVLRRAGPGGGPLGRGAARRGPRPPLRPRPGRRRPPPPLISLSPRGRGQGEGV